VISQFSSLFVRNLPMRSWNVYRKDAVFVGFPSSQFTNEELKPGFSYLLSDILLWVRNLPMRSWNVFVAVKFLYHFHVRNLPMRSWNKIMFVISRRYPKSSQFTNEELKPFSFSLCLMS